MCPARRASRYDFGARCWIVSFILRRLWSDSTPNAGNMNWHTVSSNLMCERAMCLTATLPKPRCRNLLRSSWPSPRSPGFAPVRPIYSKCQSGASACESYCWPHEPSGMPSSWVLIFLPLKTKPR